MAPSWDSVVISPGPPKICADAGAMTLFQGLPSRSLQHTLILSTLLVAVSFAAVAQTMAGAAASGQLHVRPAPQTVGVANATSVWPGGVVYYDDGGCIAGNTCPSLATAISIFNTDFSPAVQWTERTTQTTYVVITLSGTGGRGDVNTIGFPGSGFGQVGMNCNTDCNIATLLHEMGHIIGLYHEQTRTDRDSYVTVNYDNVTKGSWPGNFAIQMQNQQLLSAYDYASVMQYPSFVDTRNGAPVIETIPAGIPLQGTEGVPGAGNQDYSAGDKEAILRLYGHAPTTVTVTSNPVGLQVLVDSTPCTTPCSETWTLTSTHNISVANGVQTLTGDIENSTTSTTFYYTYGRWSDSTQQTHTITVAPGDGTPAYPATAPAIATYTANFIQLVPYTEVVTPNASGSVSASPQPQPYTGATGDFFVARQEATLTATPASTYNFYEFNAQAPYFWLPGGLSANPKTFFVPDTGNPVAVNAEFTTSPIYTVNVVPSDPIADEFSSNLFAYVDDAFWATPKNFSPDPIYDGSSWNAGTSHKLSLTFNGDTRTNPPEQPYSVNTEFTFSSWSDGGAYTHTTAGLLGASTTYTATVQPQYVPITNFGFPPCGGTAAITPASSNGGFYPWGTQLTYTATPDTANGWVFAGWTFDLTGTANPANLTAKDETLVYANFNTTNAPLTLTGLSPASVAAGSSSFTLTVLGTGFAPGSFVVVNGNFPAVTFVNSGELQVQVNSAWVTTAGNFDVYVENFPPPPESTGCAVFAYDTFAVTATGTGTITPTIEWTPPAEIVFGDVGTSVLSATTNPPDIGSFTYSATPTGGGSAVDITAGTSSLPVGTYSVTATFHPSNPQYGPATATNNLTVAGETVWVVNGGSATLTELSGDGYIFSSGAFPAANTALAIDSVGNVWTAGAGPLLEETSQVGTVQNTINSGGGLNAPAGIAIDGNSQVWITNGNNSVSLFTNGAAVSPSTGYTDPSLSTPTGIAIDLGGSVWIANKGNNSVTRILGAAAPVAPLSTAAKNKTTGTKP